MLLGQLIQNAEETARRVLRYTAQPVTLTLHVPPSIKSDLQLYWSAPNLRITAEPSRAMHVSAMPIGRPSSIVNAPVNTPPPPGPVFSPTAESRVLGSGWRWYNERGTHLTLTLLDRPHPREQKSGDMALIERSGSRLRLVVADGLGHGPAAREAAQRAIQAMSAHIDADLPEAVLRAHEQMASTRGATLGALDIDLSARVLRGTTVGNVRVMVFFGAGRVWSPCGTDAVLGHGRGSLHGRLDVRVEQHPFPPEAIVALFSDGLQNQLRLPWQRTSSDPEELATQLFGNYAVPTDDATLLLLT